RLLKEHPSLHLTWSISAKRLQRAVERYLRGWVELIGRWQHERLERHEEVLIQLALGDIGDEDHNSQLSEVEAAERCEQDFARGRRRNTQPPVDAWNEHNAGRTSRAFQHAILDDRLWCLSQCSQTHSASLLVGMAMYQHRIGIQSANVQR